MDKKQIISYYDQAEIDYKLVWNLNKSLALHFGYWDKTTKSLQEALLKENEILAKNVKISPKDICLDAGCGVGGSSIYLAKNFGAKVIGINIAKNQIESCKRNAKAQNVENLVKFYVKDFTKTGFKDEFFDVVWAIESVCHTDPKSAFINEAYRILKKGGRLIVADFFATEVNQSAFHKKIMQKMALGWGVPYFEPVIKFNKNLKDKGFKKIEIQDTTKNILPSSKRLYLFSLPAIAVGKILEILKIRTKIQTNNIWAVYYQYQALKKNLWRYKIFKAVK